MLFSERSTRMTRFGPRLGTLLLLQMPMCA